MWFNKTQVSYLFHMAQNSVFTCYFSLFMRSPQQTAGTCCFGQWSVHVADCCPSSALRTAGPACWVPESKDADLWPALTIHPDLHCPRDQTPDNLRVKQPAENQSVYFWPPPSILIKAREIILNITFIILMCHQRQRRRLLASKHRCKQCRF